MAGDSMLIVASGLAETTKLMIKSRLLPLALSYYVPRNQEELRQMIDARTVNAGCFLLDSDFLEDHGKALCETVRSVNAGVPIVMLSSETNRSFYVDAIRWGVSSFVVKPFKDDSIRTKLMECYRAQIEKSVEKITFDLEKFLMGEFRKAEKGRFPLSFMFASVCLEDPEGRANELDHTRYLGSFYETIHDLFWATDAFIRYNSRYCLGVFPFCGRENVSTLDGKIKTAFSSSYAEKNIPRFILPVTAYSSYPEDSDQFLDLQRILADRVRLTMGDARIDWFI